MRSVLALEFRIHDATAQYQQRMRDTDSRDTPENRICNRQGSEVFVIVHLRHAAVAGEDPHW